jgi:hypothetical protein
MIYELFTEKTLEYVKHCPIDFFKLHELADFLNYVG